jgi:hypothetical protein
MVNEFRVARASSACPVTDMSSDCMRAYACKSVHATGQAAAAASTRTSIHSRATGKAEPPLKYARIITWWEVEDVVSVLVEERRVVHSKSHGIRNAHGDGWVGWCAPASIGRPRGIICLGNKRREEGGTQQCC